MAVHQPVGAFAVGLEVEADEGHDTLQPQCTDKTVVDGADTQMQRDAILVGGNGLERLATGQDVLQNNGVIEHTPDDLSACGEGVPTL